QGQYEEAFHNIDIYLKKRFDLIPNLVETVKGYAKHESETLQNVIEARSKAQAATTPAEKIEANAQLTKAMHNFNMVMERYPELKANTNFLDLQNQLKSIEAELANVRKYYNATIKQFNVKIRTFPAAIIAGMMHLEKQPYFELDDPIERQNVKVEF
ncbi:MAG: LemA family protein, partial [Clostridia bacterium]|nr:LemA family protein [Clostridia bacterium]